jgi:hypothetical protein
MPYAPRSRCEAVKLVLSHGFTAAQAARKTGVHRSTMLHYILVLTVGHRVKCCKGAEGWTPSYTEDQP